MGFPHTQASTGFDRRGAALLLALAVLYAISRLPFLYWDGFPDGDQQHMALGAVEGIVSGTGFRGARLYGAGFTVGYYALLFAFRPLLASHPHAIFPLMNLLGVASGLLALVALWGLLRLLWGVRAALAGSLVLLFLPGWWELNTYGHPTAIAFALFLASLSAFVRAVSPGRPLSPGWLILSLALAAVAGSFRLDMLLATGAFPACAWVRDRRWSRATLSLLPPLAGLIAWWILHAALVPSPGGTGAPNLVDKAATILSPSLSVAKKELAILVLGIGPIAFAAAAWGWVACATGRRADAILVAGAVVVPELLWWLQVEGPFRHLLAAAIFFLVPFAAACREWQPKRIVWTALLVVASNQAISAALYPAVVRAYPWTYLASGGRRWSTRVPIGDWFTNHRAAQAAVTDEARIARWLAALDRPKILVVTPNPFRFELEALAAARHYRYRVTVDSGAQWIRLDTPRRTLLFVEGDPGPTRAALERAARDGRLNGFALFVPPDATPREALVIPPGTEVLRPPAAVS